MTTDAPNLLKPRRVYIIFNPSAGSGKAQRLETIIAHLRRRGCAISVQHTNRAGHAAELAGAASSNDFDIVVAAGGDGTINEVAHGLRNSDLPLGVIPLGTANVFAHELGLAGNKNLVVDTIASGPLVPICSGLFNGQRFIMMAGAGFDAHVVTRVSSSLKKWSGAFAFYWATCVQAFRYQPSGCDVEIDGERYRANSVFVCNGRYFGGPFTAAAQGDMRDRQLFAVLFLGQGWFNVMKYSLALIVGGYERLQDVKVQPAQTIRIQAPNPEPCQIDGEFVGHLPAEISIDPVPLVVAWPPAK